MAKQSTCHTCVYAHWDAGLWMRTLWSGFAAWPTCGNQPDSPGRMKECPRGEVCRNYRVKPPVPEGDGVKTIPLGDGVYAYVDAVDYEWLSQWTWRVHGGYAVRHESRKGKSKLVYMDREIMKPPKGKIVDHINANRFDNTRANLRNITLQQNQHNTRKRAGASSIYKGVSYNKASRRWRAQVNCGGEDFYLGEFDSEVEAARAYDCKAVEVFGEFARPNFPDQWPAERRRKVHAKWLREQGREKRGRGAPNGGLRLPRRCASRNDMIAECGLKRQATGSRKKAGGRGGTPRVRNAECGSGAGRLGRELKRRLARDVRGPREKQHV